MNLIRKYLVFTAISATAVIASARPSVLSLADHVNDSTIIYPESVETDVHKMMQNWYLENYTALDKEADYRPDVPTTDQEIIERLRTMPTAIEMPFNSVVRNYIDMYTGKKRSLIESMLGMSLYYMPIFEEALEREGIPNELKYLPVIESALNPDAVSRAGATGLWQIMLPTARGLGLEVNALIDERRDPVRSSEAATKYLRQLYEIYNDWSLAIAAYNCGPGNVNKALRRCEGDDKKDFWTIYPYLPAETRGYVPCFIAANYAMNYYNKHNISPALAKRPIITDSVHVNRRIHFRQIADILQIPVEEIQILNPQYRKQEIPGDIRPCPLVLPANQIYAYIMSEKAIAAQNAASYARRDVVEPATGLEPRHAVVNGQEGEWITAEKIKYHKVRRNETMASIAKKYGVTLQALKQANGNISKPKRGQTLKVITTEKEFRPYETQPQPDDQLLVRNPESLSDGLTTASDLTSTTVESDSVAETAAAMAAVTAEETPAPAPTASKVENTFKASKARQQAAPQKKQQPAASKKQASKTHTVRSGESLYKIAKANGTTVKELKRLNNLKSDRITPGDKLKVK